MSRFRRGANPPRQRSSILGRRTAGQVRFTQRIEVDPGKALALMSSLASGFIKKRTAAGRDIADNRFRGYSPSYTRALLKGGEDPVTVDLTLTGGLINSIGERGRTVTNTGGVVVIGPDTGTSPAVSLADGRARPTGKRSPPHNIVGAYLHFGTPRMPARKFLGLTPKERKKISKALTRQSSKVLKERRGK